MAPWILKSDEQDFADFAKEGSARRGGVQVSRPVYVMLFLPLLFTPSSIVELRQRFE